MHLMLHGYECMSLQDLSTAASWARSAMQQGLDEHSDTFKVPKGAIFAILTPFREADLKVDEEAIVRYLKVRFLLSVEAVAKVIMASDMCRQHYI